MKAQELIDILQKNPELELGKVEMSQWLRGNEKDKQNTMLDFVKVFGHFKKSPQGGTIDLRHYDEFKNLQVILWGYDVCKVVGYRIEKRTVKKPLLPSEMIDVEEEVTISVTNCDLSEGNMKMEDVILFKKE